MNSIHNRDRNGQPFDERTKIAVWAKAQIVPGYDPNSRRKDSCGAPMDYSQHGNRNSQTGWEIDHIRPKEKGGTSELTNLQPLHWENNAHKSDNYPQWTCKRRS